LCLIIISDTDFRFLLLFVVNIGLSLEFLHRAEVDSVFDVSEIRVNSKDGDSCR
jgi:hypothetical protein